MRRKVAWSPACLAVLLSVGRLVRINPDLPVQIAVGDTWSRYGGAGVLCSPLKFGEFLFASSGGGSFRVSSAAVVVLRSATPAYHEVSYSEAEQLTGATQNYCKLACRRKPPSCLREGRC